MKSIFKISTLALLLTVAVIGCKKEWDSPPVKSIPETSIITLEDVKNFYTDTAGSHRFTEELSVYATVTADETSGNLYKNVFVQDETGGLQLRLMSSGGLYEGDYVRIYLTGTTISTYQGMYQLDSVDTDRNVIKQETQNDLAPIEVTIQEINDSLKKYEGVVVKLSDVEFQICGGGDTYADAINQNSVDRNLQDCNGNSVIVRTSGYADFAGDEMPTGNGTLVAAVGNYRGTPQLIIRNPDEVVMEDLRCNGGDGDCSQPKSTISEGFDFVVDGDDACVECWQNVAVRGSRRWEGTYDDFAWSGTNVIEASGYGSSEGQLEMWMITPPVVFATNDKLTYESALAYTWEHNGITAWISKDYNGNAANISSATWVKINAPIAGQGGTGVISSGNVYIIDYVGQNYTGNYYVGFKYEGSPTQGETTTYRIDNIQITK